MKKGAGAPSDEILHNLLVGLLAAITFLAFIMLIPARYSLINILLTDYDLCIYEPFSLRTDDAAIVFGDDHRSRAWTRTIAIWPTAGKG